MWSQGRESEDPMPLSQGAFSERALFADGLEREFESGRRRLRSFPPDRVDETMADCPCTARQIAARMLEQQRAVLEIVVKGRSRTVPGPGASLLELLARYEAAHAEARLALAELSDAQWEETIETPPALSYGKQGRRGELLWLALRGMMRDGVHFSVHLRAAREAAPQLASG
jgi:hypothetical protein